MKKVAVVLLLFSLGIGGAMLFRKPAEVRLLTQRQRPSLPAPRQLVRVESNEEVQPAVASPVQGVPAAPPVPPKLQRMGGPQSQPQRPAVLQPGARPPLPQLSEFGSVGSASEMRPRPSSPSLRIPAKTRRSPSPQGSRTLEQFHTIVNGDTLERISRRYLGDSSWADTIYRINRGVIRDRNRLPLGQKIRIPARQQLSSTTAPPNTSASGLVPLPQWTQKKTN